MPNIGTMFRVEVDKQCTKYFWCVGNDSSQLGSALIVVFKRNYGPFEVPDMKSVASDDLDFYCHTFLSLGKKQGMWQRSGFLRVDREFPMLFRASSDYGNPSVRVSERWYVWHPNEPYRTVGRLTGDLRNAELGMVFPPDCVVERMRTGKYGIQHPTFDPALDPCA